MISSCMHSPGQIKSRTEQEKLRTGAEPNRTREFDSSSVLGSLEPKYSVRFRFLDRLIEKPTSFQIQLINLLGWPKAQTKSYINILLVHSPTLNLDPRSLPPPPSRTPSHRRTPAIPQGRDDGLDGCEQSFLKLKTVPANRYKCRIKLIGLAKTKPLYLKLASYKGS